MSYVALSKQLTINTPYDHQSADESWPLRFTTSGAIYSTVPQNENVLFSMNIDSLLSPKSVSLMCPSVSSRMLPQQTSHRSQRAVSVKEFMNTSAFSLERLQLEQILLLILNHIQHPADWIGAGLFL